MSYLEIKIEHWLEHYFTMKSFIKINNLTKVKKIFSAT